MAEALISEPAAETSSTWITVLLQGVVPAAAPLAPPPWRIGCQGMFAQ